MRRAIAAASRNASHRLGISSIHILFAYFMLRLLAGALAATVRYSATQRRQSVP
jgi:hypothetical protein